ncbi:MAG: 4Fe-4S dicluster domain-containing protein [Methylocystaceae bacterium]
MAKKMANLYDTSKCTACRGCSVACKNWNQLPGLKTEFKGSYQVEEGLNADTFTLIKFFEYEDNMDGLQWDFIKFQCMHCEHPACMEVCPRKALTKTEWGAVVKDYDKCIGCQYCAYACPFQVPQYEKRADVVTKCTLCAERVGNGQKPACAQTCPTGALIFGDRDELLGIAEDRVAYLRKNGFPRAQVYGKLELGGLNNLYVLHDSPDKFGLPVNPKVAGQVRFWQRGVQPYVAWLIPLALAGSAFSFVTTRVLKNMQSHGEGGNH